MDGNPAVEQKLGVLENKPPLNREAVSIAIRGINPDNIEAIRANLGVPLQYSQRTEQDVAGLSVGTLLPRAMYSGHPLGRFLEIWVPDEQGHGEALAELLGLLGLELFEGADENHIPPHNRAIGLFGRLSEAGHQTIEHVYHTIGAINERMARQAYTSMRTYLEGIGEVNLAEVLFKKLQKDELSHLGYYRTYAQQLGESLKPWQRTLSRVIITNTWSPVGAGSKPDKVIFGEVLDTLTRIDPHGPDIVPLVEEIAQELLYRPDNVQKEAASIYFIGASLEKCRSLRAAATQN